MRGLLALAPLALLAACTVGPDYKPPQTKAPPAFAETQGFPAPTANDVDLSAWWKSFHDPELDALIAKALSDNPNLLAAASKVAEARAQEGMAQAGALPSVTATGSTVGLDSNRPSGGLPIPDHLQLYSAGFDASWEIDLWGKVRRGVEAANADVDAAEWSRRDGQVSLLAEVASDYLSLRATQARIALGNNELAQERGIFRMIQDRRTSGFVTDLDVNQQGVEVATAASQIPQLDAEARSQIYAIAVLDGQAPESMVGKLEPSGSATVPPPPPALPVGLPSELLRRRPDIREAERRLAAANARIGVQQADLYPKFDLLGLLSFSATSLEGLFDPRNLGLIGAATASEKLFDGGKTEAAIKAATEERNQALLAYKGTVLAAFRDVETALARYKAEDQRRTSLEQAADSARKSFAIAQDQYKTGFVTFINVEQSENSVLESQDKLLQAQAALSTDLVALYKALGGGWS